MTAKTCVAALAAMLCLTPTGFGQEEKPKIDGRFIRVALPINGQVFSRTRSAILKAADRAKQQNARLTLILELDAPKGVDGAGRGSEFGASLDLATFLTSAELAGVRTVAYAPRPSQGHAVLAAMACQEIVMAPKASLGAAGIDEKTITPTLRSAYAEVANRRRTVPAALALGLLDPAVEVLRVETEAGAEWVTPEGFETLKQQRTVKEPAVVKRAGQPAELSGVEARRLGLAGYLADDRRELARALQLPRSAVEDDPSLLGGWRPVRVDLKGPIRGDAVDQVIRLIEEQVRQRDVNFVCLWIDSPGGSPLDAMRLAEFLAFQLDPGKVRTVAYVPREARGDAALAALACDQLVLGQGATLGGSGAYVLSSEEIENVRHAIHKQLAPRKNRTWSLWAAMFDPQLNVHAFRNARLGETEYFCDDELAEQPEPDKWQRGPMITRAGGPLKLSGRQAEDYQLANHLADNFSQFKRLYGLADDPTLVEPGWADFLIQALASPELAALLLVLGGAALYIELHAPGIGIGGFVATVCFLLFFWSRYLGGTAGWLEVSLFIAGVSCLLLELFVIPGFGIFGLGGGALVLAALILASPTFLWPRTEYQFDQLERSLLTLAAAGIGLAVVAFILRKRLPRSPLLSRMMLEPPEGREAETIQRREALVDRRALLGQRGATTTQLTPGGKARFGELLVDVMADGEVIARGAVVEVVEVHGNRVVVKEVESG